MRWLFLLFALPLAASLPSQQEALALAFPGAAVARRELPGAPAFEARRDGHLVGVGFFDTHRVRTQNETVLVAIAMDGRILRVEVVAFGEPAEYMARGAWLRQFDGRRLDPDLALGRGIKPLAGSTLTATSLAEAGRRALARFKETYGTAK